MNIEWRKIPSWPGFEASSDGKIRLTVQRRSHMPRILKASLSSSKYFVIGTMFDGVKKQESVHRLVCEAFYGPPPSEASEVRHLDGAKQNNCAENLCWGNAKENAIDRKKHGRDRIGSQHHSAKITEADVNRIFELRDRGFGGKYIAAMFSINTSTVNRILARKLWKHVHV